MPVAGEDLAGARQAVGTLLPLAVQAAGGMRPDEDRHTYLARVRQLAVDLWLETSAESETVRRIAELAACRTFPAVLLGVRVEPSTTRGVLTLRSWGPDGERQEEIRTDRTDDPRGVRTLELARGLVGRRVTVYKLEEPGRSAHQRYRCAKHLVDLGPAEPTPAEPAAVAPDPGAPRPASGQPGAGHGTVAARAGTGEPPPPVGSPGAGLPPLPAVPTDQPGSPAAVGYPGPGRAGTGQLPPDDGGSTPTPPAAARRPARHRAGTARGAGAPPPGETHRSGEPALPTEAPAAAPPAGPGGVGVERARAELLAAIGGDEEYRAAALHGIMRRAATDDDGAVVNVALLRVLAARTPERDTAAGQKILADYRASAPAG